MVKVCDGPFVKLENYASVLKRGLKTLAVGTDYWQGAAPGKWVINASFQSLSVQMQSPKTF